MSTSQKRYFNDIFTNFSAGSASITPGAATTGTTVTSTIAVPGCLVGDVVFASAPAALGNVQMVGEVTAAGTVTLKFSNTTAGTLTPPAGVYTVIACTVDAKMGL
jgi:hypothetical protein